ncbi:hypothetical protein DRQ36_10360 [bacterium]|nr:MAG: hypothetical protein DRQ36_10360 [bacterium]
MKLKKDSIYLVYVDKNYERLAAFGQIRNKVLEFSDISRTHRIPIKSYESKSEGVVEFILENGSKLEMITPTASICRELFDDLPKRVSSDQEAIDWLVITFFSG